MVSTEKIYNTLTHHFGYDGFREGQEAIITHFLAGKDGLVIMPTGGGKSMCYQLPALLQKGTTLVVSPLIALMKDQVDALKTHGIAAAFFNSSQTEIEQAQILEAVKARKLKLLYVAPESLAWLESVMKPDYISAIAIDEAHCISAWGHDFRPSYQQLGYLKKRMPQVPILALTATADKATRQDILDQLGIGQAKQFVSSFDRPNLFLEVRPADKRLQQITAFIRKQPDSSGIIYCLSRKTTETLADKLVGQGFDAAAYHAGLEFTERAQVQEDFVHDRSKIVCATIAFGMGIDKSNVRWVIHYNMPKNIEGYYQEIGRAGRDGLPSEALLFHSYADVIQLRKFMEGATNEEVQEAKLERMKQFSEATSCRRKILLTYFGEAREEDCGHCDVCLDPPNFFDATVLAQKALSVVVRTGEKEAMGTVIDVLRGARNANVLDKGYDKVRSYGVGKDVSWRDWQHYLIMMINQGAMEVAYHEHGALKCTEFSKRILFKGDPIQITRPQEGVERKRLALAKNSVPELDAVGVRLFERLKELRVQLAQTEGVPAYVVFSDASLKDMALRKPGNDAAFLEVSGVGQHKLTRFGADFLQLIRDFAEAEGVSLHMGVPKTAKAKKERKSNKRPTHLVSYDLFQEGKSVDEVAENRGFVKGTIVQHIIKAQADGLPLDRDRLVSKEILDQLRGAHSELGNPMTLKAYYDYFEQQISYDDIRLGLLVLESD